MVYIVTEVQAALPGARIPANTFPKVPDRHWGPPTLLFNGSLLQVVKGPGREANHLHSSSGEF